MYDFKETSPKRYGRVKRGWHKARIYQATLKNSRGGRPGQYIKVDFEILREKTYSDVLVPGFFNHYGDGKPDPKFMNMGMAAGLRGTYGNNIQAVLADLIGKELMVFVAHRYRDGYRRERAEDFEICAEDTD